MGEFLVASLIPTTLLVGIIGGMIGWILLGFLMPGVGWLSSFVGAVLGAFLAIWIRKNYLRR